MQSVLLYPRRSRFAPNLLKNSHASILTPGPANVNSEARIYLKNWEPRVDIQKTIATSQITNKSQ
jgi:hypothetical protein